MKIIQLYFPHTHRPRLPKEDAWVVDAKNKIFAVADGVHLYKGIEYKKKYPRPSPAGKLAQKFCDVFVRNARRGMLKNAFRKANRSVFIFNKNRDKYSVFQNASCYYAATAAFLRICSRRVEYGNICDAGVAAIGPDGRLLFWNRDHTHHHGFDLSRYSEMDRTFLLRTVFRNAVGARGEKKGYGVVTGERAAEIYVRYGKANLRKNAVYLLATDGFEMYLSDLGFRKALFSFDKKKIYAAMTLLQKANKNNDEFFRERALVAVKI